MSLLKQLKTRLHQVTKTLPPPKAIFCKTGVGDYAEHDQFIGTPVPILRTLAREFEHLSREQLQTLIESRINEERLLALFILVTWYKKADSVIKNELYNFYLSNLAYVNNWNLVDSSAHLIIGAHLFREEKGILLELAQSQRMWDRRIAMVATLYFIRHDELEWTFKLAQILLSDKQDLIHKAVGWMLREARKRKENELITFLDLYAAHMPRTMLRYAIEKLSPQQKKLYLM